MNGRNQKYGDKSALTALDNPTNVGGESTMWTKPKFEDIRLGFEITMYFKTR